MAYNPITPTHTIKHTCGQEIIIVTENEVFVDATLKKTWFHYSYLTVEAHIPIRCCPSCGEKFYSGDYKTLAEVEAELVYAEAERIVAQGLASTGGLLQDMRETLAALKEKRLLEQAEAGQGSYTLPNNSVVMRDKYGDSWLKRERRTNGQGTMYDSLTFLDYEDEDLLQQAYNKYMRPRKNNIYKNIEITQHNEQQDDLDHTLNLEDYIDTKLSDCDYSEVSDSKTDRELSAVEYDKLAHAQLWGEKENPFMSVADFKQALEKYNQQDFILTQHVYGEDVVTGGAIKPGFFVEKENNLDDEEGRGTHALDPQIFRENLEKSEKTEKAKTIVTTGFVKIGNQAANIMYHNEDGSFSLRVGPENKKQ